VRQTIKAFGLFLALLASSCAQVAPLTETATHAFDESASVYRSFSLEHLPVHFVQRLGFPADKDFIKDFWNVAHSTPQGFIYFSLEVEIPKGNPYISRFYDMQTFRKRPTAPDDWSDVLQENKGTFEISSKTFTDSLEKLFAQRHQMFTLLTQATSVEGKPDCSIGSDAAVGDYQEALFHYHVSFPVKHDAAWAKQITNFLAQANRWSTVVAFDREGLHSRVNDDSQPSAPSNRTGPWWLFRAGVAPMDARVMRVVQCSLQSAMAEPTMERVGAALEDSPLSDTHLPYPVAKTYAVGLRAAKYRDLQGNLDLLRLGFEVRVFEQDLSAVQWLIANMVNFLKNPDEPVKLGDVGTAYALGDVFLGGDAACDKPGGEVVPVALTIARQLSMSLSTQEKYEDLGAMPSTRDVWRSNHPGTAVFMIAFLSWSFLEGAAGMKMGKSFYIDVRPQESDIDHDMRERFTYFYADLHEATPFAGTSLEESLMTLRDTTARDVESDSLALLHLIQSTVERGDVVEFADLSGPLSGLFSLPTRWVRADVNGVAGFAHYM